MSITHNNTNQIASKFLDELVLNVVLKELSPELREEFYTLIKDKDYEQAQIFVNRYIPDLEDKLLKKTKELLVE